MRWVDRWQNQGKQACGAPMGVSALLLVPSLGSITSWGPQGGPKSTADYGTGSTSLPCKRSEPQHTTSCLLGSLPCATRCSQPTLYSGTLGSVQCSQLCQVGAQWVIPAPKWNLGLSGVRPSLVWPQAEHFVCQWAQAKAKAEPGCNMKKQDEFTPLRLPEAASTGQTPMIPHMLFRQETSISHGAVG